MSFHEKSAWISLAALGIVYGWYFWTLSKVVEAGGTGEFDYLSQLIGAVVAVIIVQIVLTIFISARRPKEANAPEDEREKLIGLKATRFGFYVLLSCALTAAAFIAGGIPQFYAANGVFLAVVLGEAARNLAQIVYFRMGA